MLTSQTWSCSRTRKARQTGCPAPPDFLSAVVAAELLSFSPAGTLETKNASTSEARHAKAQQAKRRLHRPGAQTVRRIAESRDMETDVPFLSIVRTAAFARSSSARKRQPFDSRNMFSTRRALDCNSVRGVTAAPRARETGTFGTVDPPVWPRVAKMPPLRLHLVMAGLELPGSNGKLEC